MLLDLSSLVVVAVVLIIKYNMCALGKKKNSEWENKKNYNIPQSHTLPNLLYVRHQ